MKKRISACAVGIIFMMSCNKKADSGHAIGLAGQAAVEVKTIEPVCAKEIICDKPVKAGETGIVLPVGTKLCIPKDQNEVRVELPVGYTFNLKGEGKAAPVVFATYSCSCSQSGSACQVFYAEGMGFGCLQSSCTGSCTGKFGYKGYTVDRLIYTGEKEKYFQQPDVQEQVIKMASAIDPAKPFVICELPGVRFAIVNNEQKFMAAATCDCEGTQACKLKVVNIPFIKTQIKIYYCDGPCNGCELSV